MNTVKIKFLGTGGGRFVMISQKRRTGGMVFYDSRANDDLHLYVDPGPGALVYSLQEGIALNKLDGLIVTHAHLDHSNDAEAIIEAMTHGCKNERGVLIANSTVLNGVEVAEEDYTQVISEYHQNAVERIIEMKEGRPVELKGRTMQFLRTKHGDPNTMAFKIASEKTIGFITDTELFDNLLTFFSDSDYLVINVLRPLSKKWQGHLNVEDAAEIINAIEPTMAILQHFGYNMLYSSLEKQRNFLEEKTKGDTEITFAKDFQTVDFEGKGLEKFM